MATLNYKVKLIARTGRFRAAGWTYHHVLAWRYYFFASHTLVMMARYLLSREPDFERSMTKHALYPAVKGDAELLRNAGKVREIFGNDSRGFAAGVDFKPLDVLKIMFRMSSDLNRTISDTNATGHLDPSVMSQRCLNPPFGGFLGMAPAQRLDDPEERCEMVRPFSFNRPQWGLLQSLREVLISFSSDITNVSEDRVLNVCVPREAWSVFLPCIERLGRDYNRNPNAFHSSDWDYRTHSDSQKQAWTLVNELPDGGVRDRRLGCVFRLNSNGQGDQPDRPNGTVIDLIRGDGEDVTYLFPIT